MALANLNAWQLLLWISGLEILSAPIIVTIVNSVQNNRYKAREAHIGRMSKAFGEMLTKVAEDIQKKASEAKGSEKTE